MSAGGRACEPTSWSDGSPGGMSVAQNGQTCHRESTGWPHDGQADFNRVVQTGHTT